MEATQLERYWKVCNRISRYDFSQMEGVVDSVCRVIPEIAQTVPPIRRGFRWQLLSDAEFLRREGRTT
jgi:hypothetical protein